MKDALDQVAATRFLLNLLSRTESGGVTWEKTADPNQLIATLPGDYIVQLSEVPDLENRDSSPDWIVTLSKKRERLFTIDRTDLFAEAFRAVEDNYFDNPYQLFQDLWKLARLQVSEANKHLSALNELMAESRSATRPKNSKETTEIDDDDIPF